VVSRLGLEPRALALKAPPLLKKINTMILPNRPMSDKYLHRVTMCVSYIGQPPSCGVESVKQWKRVSFV